MATRKNLVTLSMQQRLEVLEDLKTLSVSVVASKYSVDVSTIRRIKQNTAKVLAFADKDKVQKQRQRIKKAANEELEERLLTWFIERRTLGDFLSDALLLEKATELRDTIESCSDFKVSDGWLAGFKQRHSIRLVRTYGESAGADEDAAQKFITEFQKLMEEEDISEENIYNMDESGLLWRTLPSKTLAERKEKRIKGFKSRKERITIALCANATGTHKLMPLVINKYLNPRALKHCRNRLSVIFKAQSNAWMTKSLFIDWYENDFKPSVRAYQAQNAVGKVVLLLDNCAGHKVPANIQEDSYFKIMYLPPNTTSLIQPLDQGIFAKIKILYRHKILRRATTHIGGVTEFHKYFSLKDCIDAVEQSWTEVTLENIRNAWKKIIPEQRDIYESQMLHDISMITGESCSEADLTEFIADCEASERKDFIGEKDEDEEEQESIEDERETEDQEVEEEPNQNKKDELQYLFQRLGHYISTEIPFVQHIFQSLKSYILGNFNINYNYNYN